MKRVLFFAGLRTPFGRAFKGAYKDVRPDDLLVKLLRGHRDRHAGFWQSQFDDFVVGCAYPEGEQGYNIARTVALGAGMEVPGATVNRLCASSMEAIAIAGSRIASGWGDCYLVGGVESMSRIPRRGANFSESDLIKCTNGNAYVPNGDTAEKVARQYADIDRLQQEDLAARSHELAAAAYESGNYENQVFPYLVERDEFIRVPVNREKMANLAPAFDEQGVVTAATSSPLTDGACCGLVGDIELAQKLGAEHGLEIVDVAVGHVAPEVMGMGPVPAVRAILERQQILVSDLAAVEINEAFAIQVLASLQELQIDLDVVNSWGGAMALGHPLGASGLRLVMTLHDRLAELGRDGALGLATLCVGGGQGMAMLFKFHAF